MDVTFDEDRSRVRNENSAENMSVLRAIALNLLKRDTSKSSLR
jgi:predicted transposase YbfD/YdcC